MEITRLQPFPLVFSQPGFDADTDYIVIIYDDHNNVVHNESPSSDLEGNITFDLPEYFSKYDDEYRVEIYTVLGFDSEGLEIIGDLIWIDTMTIMRPYIDPQILADTPDDIAEAEMYESIARAIINSITGGFMYKRDVVETVGMGNDYLAVPFRLNRILQVVENNIVVYDAENTDPAWKNVRGYYITPDKGAISVQIDPSEAYNRLQSQPVLRQRGASDSFTRYNTNDSPNYIDAPYDTKNYSTSVSGSPMFPNGWDYTVTVEAGWPIIPQDIKQATMLIVNDLKCNNIPYINSYIKDYKSDQFTLSFDPGVFRDTGNRIADKILSAYVRPIYRLGVL
jgi:hypothetical protein